MDPEAVASRIIDQGLTVRDVEKIAQQEARGESGPPAKAAKPEKDPDTRSLEPALEDVLGLSVSIEHRTAGGGQVRISYRTLEQLDALCHRLKG